jgi:hypothetical protein
MIRSTAPWLAAAILLAVPATAAAGPARWTKLTGLDYTADTTDEVGLARTPDGVLHVAYHEPPASIKHLAILPDGTRLPGATTIAAFTLGAHNRPALTAAPNGIQAFFAGLHAGGERPRMSSASSADGFGWQLEPVVSNADITNPHKPYDASGIGAASAAGVPVFAWGDSDPGAGGIHEGVDPTTPDREFPETARCCEVDPNVAVDAAGGQVVVAWNSEVNDNAQALYLGGAGDVMAAPGSAARQQGQRVGLTARIGAPGVYLGYTAGANAFDGHPALWLVGTGRTLTLARQRRARFTGAAAAHDGRLWLFWAREERLFATRSNTAATRLGAVVSVRAPGRTTAILRLAGEGSTGPLDLLAHVRRSAADVGTWHRRIRPGLSVVAKRKGRRRLEIRVTDAGEPVARARVRVRGRGFTRTVRTDGAGRARARVRGRRLRLRAVKPGYVNGYARVR